MILQLLKTAWEALVCASGGEPLCRTCWRPAVGLSVYCRRHTDEILGDR